MPLETGARGFLPGAYSFAEDLLIVARSHDVLEKFFSHIPHAGKGMEKFSRTVDELVSGDRADIKLLFWNEEDSN